MQDILKFDEAASRRRVRNRRVMVRYQCAPATAGRIYIADDQEFQRAWIENLSIGGVGMYLSRPVAVGTLIVVEIRSHPSGTVHELGGEVKHSSLKEPYGWYVGVEFLQPINEVTLDALL
jgi:hypothetical protein